MNFLITMPDAKELEHMATNFKQQKNEAVELLRDSPQQDTYLDMIRLNNLGMVLREFQEYVLSLINSYHRVMDDDELIEAIADGSADPDLLAVIALITKVEESESQTKVLSIIPIDFNGTMAVVLTKR